MQHELIRFALPAAAQGARDRGGNAAAHRALRHVLHQHQHRHHQRHARQHGRTQARQKPGLDQPGGGLRKHHQDVRPGQPRQRGRDGRVQHGVQARIGGAWRGRRWHGKGRRIGMIKFTCICQYLSTMGWTRPCPGSSVMSLPLHFFLRSARHVRRPAFRPSRHAGPARLQRRRPAQGDAARVAAL
ncbi:hypothetical protein D3C85_1115600 [compost metagenome]